MENRLINYSENIFCSDNYCRLLWLCNCVVVWLCGSMVAREYDMVWFLWLPLSFSVLGFCTSVRIGCRRDSGKLRFNANIHILLIRVLLSYVEYIFRNLYNPKPQLGGPVSAALRNIPAVLTFSVVSLWGFLIGHLDLSRARISAYLGTGNGLCACISFLQHPPR